MELNVSFETITCDKCGLVFALPKTWINARRNDHENFFCPGCRVNWHFPQESDTEKLKRLLRQEKECCISAKQSANYFEKSASSYKGHFARVKKKLGIVGVENEG